MVETVKGWAVLKSKYLGMRNVKECKMLWGLINEGQYVCWFNMISRGCSLEAPCEEIHFLVKGAFVHLNLKRLFLVFLLIIILQRRRTVM